MRGADAGVSVTQVEIVLAVLKKPAGEDFIYKFCSACAKVKYF